MGAHYMAERPPFKQIEALELRLTGEPERSRGAAKSLPESYLGLSVIAEGIEDRATADSLVMISWEDGQGFSLDGRFRSASSN
jgi:hypothetical protein